MSDTDYFPHLCTCGKNLTKKDAKYIGESDMFGISDWFNCPNCSTTFVKFRDGGKELEHQLEKVRSEKSI